MSLNTLGNEDELTRNLIRVDFVSIEYQIQSKVLPSGSEFPYDGNLVFSHQNVVYCTNIIGEKFFVCGIRQWNRAIWGQNMYWALQ